eukprot:PLAT15592.1.p1 GENE.PLAT15592.1~~PLAT15592.1.p1  ORF type:complete len:734 (+),score=301.29 PLAT15592.1:366-2567(+)
MAVVLLAVSVVQLVLHNQAANGVVRHAQLCSQQLAHRRLADAGRASDENGGRFSCHGTNCWCGKRATVTDRCRRLQTLTTQPPIPHNMRFSLLLALAALLRVGAAFYLPGIAPREYEHMQNVSLKVNKLTSVHTHLPYDYYMLPYCKPAGGVKAYPENLGEVLMGDAIENSPYELKMLKNEKCKVLCRHKLQEEELQLMRSMIDEGYSVNWIVDNLPAATVVPISSGGAAHSVTYEHGWQVGAPYADGKRRYYMNNHISITIKVHELANDDRGRRRIVGFEVEPFSVRHAYNDWPAGAPPPTLTTCDPGSGVLVEHRYTPNYLQMLDKPGEVIYTYDVEWVPSETRWASRWDIYLSVDAKYVGEVHWFSIVNSVLIVLFLSGMVGMILMRALHADCLRYNRVLTEEEREEEREESGWKLVHGDVFRPPARFPMLLAVLTGTGVQILAMAVITLFFAVLGFLSPATRGSLMVALLLLYMLMGASSGYCTARNYKLFGGEQWKRATLLTATLFPGFVFVIFFVLDILMWANHSTAAIPFSSMFGMLLLWLLTSVPLVYLGAYWGFRRDLPKLPVETAVYPRPVPQQAWYMSPAFTTLVGGVLPFGAVFVDLYFILGSLWLDRYYYVFGFFMLVFIILIITCAEIAIVLCYFQLCSEQHRWWWRAFLTPASSSVYLFLYAVWYSAHNIRLDLLISSILYFSYMLIISVAFACMCGAVGFYACLWFNLRIYGALKVD